MCIATATASELVSVAMEHCGLYEYFPKVFSCGDIGKGKDQPDIFLQAAAWLGERMAASVLARPFFACADVVIPVPLHAQRLEQRGYNQSLLLSQELCSHTGQPLLADGLIRSRNTGTQVGRTREERLHALRGAFAVSSPSAVNGKRILLVDDVLTTGATAIACAEALWWTGAVSVSLATACRAQRD